MRDEACGNCRFFGDLGEGRAVCRHDPPQLVTSEIAATSLSAAGYSAIGVWPPTAATEWCGKWKGRK